MEQIFEGLAQKLT